MNYQKIIHTIQEAGQNDVKLNLEETLKVMDAFKHVSMNKQFIKKATYLLLIVSKKLEKANKLSSRETQIFNLIGLGYSSKEISDFLSISEDTVSTHRKNIIKKLELKGTGKLQKAAFQYAHEQLHTKNTP